MVVAALSRRDFARSGRKPALVETSALGVLCAVATLGCGTTPIEAVVEDDTSSIAEAGASNAGGEACDEPLAGRFTLSAEAGCLRRGAATTVFGNPAFLTELSADCESALAQWDLTPAVAGTFTLRNVETQLSLDVRAAAEIPGTPIIVYDPNTLDNQRFWFRARSAGGYELSPRHAPLLCAEGRAGGVEARPCRASVPAQTFHLARVGCPE